MPNTLAHLGVQGLATKSVLRQVDLKWVYLGCIIPDVPWILQRVIHWLFVGFDPYDLRLYTMVQASLAFCILLSAAVAAFSIHYWRTFAILALNSFLHLLLDAMQTKWANGVHFLAPFDWRLTNFGLFWPEHILGYLMTVLGLAFVLATWRNSFRTPLDLTWPAPKRGWVASALLVVYFVLPVFLMSGPEEANNHFVKTLRHRHDWPGRHIALDRVSYSRLPSGNVIQSFIREPLYVEDLVVDPPATVSLRGFFISENRIQVQEYRLHPGRLRDYATYLGLALVVFLWSWVLVRSRIQPKQA